MYVGLQQDDLQHLTLLSVTAKYHEYETQAKQLQEQVVLAQLQQREDAANFNTFRKKTEEKEAQMDELRRQLDDSQAHLQEKFSESLEGKLNDQFIEGEIVKKNYWPRHEAGL